MCVRIVIETKMWRNLNIPREFLKIDTKC
jgi:hypothetical protein